MRLKLDIPDVPPSLNKLLRMHWAAKVKLKNLWLLFIRSQLPALYLKPLVRMRVQVTLHHARLYDQDNAYGAAKVIFDVLKHHRLIFDDSPEYMDASVKQAQCPHKQRHTTIELEPFADQAREQAAREQQQY